MQLFFNQSFANRQEISDILGGDTQKGIAKSRKTNTILLFMNKDELYTDSFYPIGSYLYCTYTGIGRFGNQDNVDENNMYNLNAEIMMHRFTGRQLLMFEKRGSQIFFVGEYELIETTQEQQPDELHKSRRVFKFHLKQKSPDCIISGVK